MTASLSNRVRALEKRAENEFVEAMNQMDADTLAYFAVHGYLPGAGAPEPTPAHIAECWRELEERQ